MTIAASSQPLMEDTTSTKRQRLTTSTGTLTSPSPSLSSSSVSYLPFDLVEEILCRLPVKFLLQLRCVCKSWNSLISNDPKFAKKHLRMSTATHHLILSLSIFSSSEINFISYPLHSVFTTVTINATQLEYPPLHNRNYFQQRLFGSCDGIICFAINPSLALLWNPCLKKVKELPSLEIPHWNGVTLYSFGYDPFTDNYKVVAIFCPDHECYRDHDGRFSKGLEIQVKVHTLGTDSWRRIQDFPSMMIPVRGSGKFVSGSVNWLASTEILYPFIRCKCFIISLDLGKESYQEILQPDYGVVDIIMLTLGVLRDCLCILNLSSSSNDLWLMKEYGNKESWIKLFSIPTCCRDLSFHPYCVKGVYYIYEEDQVLLKMKVLLSSSVKTKLVVYNFKNDTFRIPEIQDFDGRMLPNVYVESLISPF